MFPLSPTLVEQAAARLAGIVNKTPVFTSRTLNERVGREVFLKCENFQRVGAFKFRGAYNAISQLTDIEKAAGVVTHSSGNHAQGVALASQLLGVKATIVMPDDAPAVKKAATAGYGAEIVTCRAAEREKVSGQLVAERGYTLIHPYDNEKIIAGQGTAAWELFDDVGELDALFTPVGGGGLISGSALATAVRSPNCRVIGVEPAIADDANRSWRSGAICVLDNAPPTAADGLRTRFIGERNFSVMRQYVHDMTTVAEDDIWETLHFLWTRMKLLVEPSAAVALAPLFSGVYKNAGRRVGVILSGGNADIEAVAHQFGRRFAVAPARPQADDPIAPPTTPARPRILVCEEMADEALEILREVGQVDLEPTIKEEALGDKIRDYQAVIVGREMRMTGVTIGAGIHLRAIGTPTTRLDHINVMATRRLGVEICHAPGLNAVAIAEHTMGRLIMTAAQFGDGRLSGKTLGIIGFGSVGRELAQRAKAFGMRILVNQPLLTPELAMADGVESADLHDLLRQSDFVSLHVPVKATTTAIIDAKELALMKPTACLINTGHTDLVIDAALYEALENGKIAGAAVAALPPQVGDGRESERMVRRHPRVLVAPHVTAIIGERQREKDTAVAKKIAALLRTRQTKDSLALELVPVGKVIPHEQIDDKRVARLMERLEDDGILANPPIATYWKGRYIVLDGATRSTAFKRLGYPHLIVQVVPPQQKEFELHTWYHSISSPQPFAALRERLAQIDGLLLTPIAPQATQDALKEDDTLCYFMDRDGATTLVKSAPGADHLAVMNVLVATYTEWGNVERTLLTTASRLLTQFPEMTAVAIFPQFKPETVFEVASRGDLLPAGLTRFIIPGRILRLNADLRRLKQDEPLTEKQRWFDDLIESKLTKSRLRYYQEPVILLDE